jgi:hypothetical protein
MHTKENSQRASFSIQTLNLIEIQKLVYIRKNDDILKQFKVYLFFAYDEQRPNTALFFVLNISKTVAVLFLFNCLQSYRICTKKESKISKIINLFRTFHVFVLQFLYFITLKCHYATR